VILRWRDRDEQTPAVPGRAPRPLEEYAAQFDDDLGTLAQWRGFRESLQGLLLPRHRHKTLTELVGTEPVGGAQAPSFNRLQFLLSESPWDAEAINRQRLELVATDPVMAPDADSVLVIDDSGDRKAGIKAAHVVRQYLGSIGKADGGIVAIASLWADDRIHYPLHARL
jgi:SRSO17 transposase